MAFPPRGNLLGEVILIRALMAYYVWFLVPLRIIGFAVGVYSVVLYSCVQHGCIAEIYLRRPGRRAALVHPRFILMTFLVWVPLNLFAACLDVFCGGL